MTKLPDPLALENINPAACKRILHAANTVLDSQFSPRHSVRKLLRTRAHFIDKLLQRLWREHAKQPQGRMALIGTGGYGREELHPHSDIDLLILVDEEATPIHQEYIERFVSLLWSLKINISHSVRTLDECVTLAKKDISVITSLMESRCIAGSSVAHHRMMQRISSQQLWPSPMFCKAKLDEQKKREGRYSNVSYNLEPHLKNSPGGLREIQTLLWIMRRHFGTKNLNHLVEKMFLTKAEVRLLRQGRDFLWRVRYLMHVHSKRCKDRLDFGSQHQMAKAFGYQDADNKLAVELFMKTYYRWVFKLRMISSLLVRHFEEHILLACKSQNTRDLNARFRLCNNYIEIKNPNVFKEHPNALMEIFLLIAQDKNIIGIRSATLRLLYKHRFLIGKLFRADPRNAECFIRILKSGEGVGRVLHLMRRYEILGHWLPEFAKVSGQMQHDLFHAYTVDAHLVEVVRNACQLMHPDMQSDLDLPERVARRIPKPELLYIAALYHDIAKGRGGDHSELGVADIVAFAERHQLHERDISLLAWLVRHHLLMSSTAQKQDSFDPEVISKFSEIVGNIERLDHLYVLTVADIRATNPKLWNGWRASLLQDLYLNARQALLRGNREFVDREKYLGSIKNQSMVLLKQKKVSARKVKALWKTFDSEYFIREKVDDIAWQTAAMVTHTSDKPLVVIRDGGEFKSRPAMQIFIYTKHEHNILSVVTNTLERNGANIQYAHMIDTSSNHVLSSAFVLPRKRKTAAERKKYCNSLTRAIEDALSSKSPELKTVRHFDTPELKTFSVPLHVRINHEQGRPYNVLEITTVDRDGMLSCLTQTLDNLKLQLRGARITTLGERVDDVFYITDQNGAVIEDKKYRAELEYVVRHDLESWVSTGKLG